MNNNFGDAVGRMAFPFRGKRERGLLPANNDCRDAACHIPTIQIVTLILPPISILGV